MDDKQITETELNKVVRSRVFVLLDGTFAVRWQENRVQELQTGQYRAYHKREFGTAISDYELKQLQNAGIVENFDDDFVWFCPMPKQFEVQFKTMWERMRARSYYLNTTLASARYDDVAQTLADHNLQDVFQPRLRDDFVVLWSRNGLSFRRFEEAEIARNQLIDTAPDVFSETVVAFVETSRL